jgi:DNA polymerase-3 subunit epsilon
MKMCYIDTETTGLDAKRHGIIQIAAIMEIEGEVVDRINLDIRPASCCACDAKALEISGKTLEQIKEFPHEADQFREFCAWLGAHVEKFDRMDKAFFCGYNSPFDVEFMRMLFERNGDKYFGSWFWSGSIDVMGLALLKLRDVRHEMENFKLGTVAEKVLGAETVAKMTSEIGLHNAMTDIELTREIFLRVAS